MSKPPHFMRHERIVVCTGQELGSVRPYNDNTDAAIDRCIACKEALLLEIILVVAKIAEQARHQDLTYEPVEEYDPEATRLTLASDAAEKALDWAILKLRRLIRTSERLTD